MTSEEDERSQIQDNHDEYRQYAETLRRPRTASIAGVTCLLLVAVALANDPQFFTPFKQ
jgi:hypothetical protein